MHIYMQKLHNSRRFCCYDFGAQSHWGRSTAPERHRALLLVSVVDPHGGAFFLKRRGAVFVTSRDGALGVTGMYIVGGEDGG